MGRPSSVALLLALAACGCGGSRSDFAEASASSRAVELRPDPAAATPAPALVRARHVVPTGLAPWRVTRGEHRVIPRELGSAAVPVLELLGGSATVVVPGPLAEGEIDQIELRIESEKALTARVELAHDGTEARSREARLGGGQGARTLLVPLPGERVHGDPEDELRVHFAWSGAPLTLVSIALVDRPLARWLDEGADAPGLVPAEGDRRRGMIVAEERALVATFDARAGERLELALASIEDTRPPDGAQSVVVALEGARGDLREHAFPLDAERASRWSVERIELEPFAGGPVEARFELRGGGAALVAEPRIVRARAAAPAVLLVTSDTHRGDHVGAAGEGVGVRTPAIDGLARRGLYFPRAQATTNITIPSHAALLTGTHPRDTRLVSNYTGLAHEAPTLAEAFHAAGWRTWAALSARHLLDPGNLGQGFERASAPLRPSRDGAETLEVLERWLSEGDGEPLLVWLHLFDPHTPYRAPREFAARHDSTLRAKRGRARAGARLGDGSANGDTNGDGNGDGNGDSNGAGNADANGAAPDRELVRGRALYRAEIDYTDSLVARVLAHPRFAGAIVALTGDHGESLGEHGVRFAHVELYPDTLRVPLVLAWPDAPRGRRVDAVVDHLGLGRTLLELAGVGAQGFPGTSLVELAHAGGASTPAFAISAEGASASITHERWHLLLHLRPHSIGFDAEQRRFEELEVELYDLAADPACRENLVEREHATATRLRAALVAWLSSGQETGWRRSVVLDDATRAQLAAMGYSGGETAQGERWLDPESDVPWARRFR